MAHGRFQTSAFTQGIAWQILYRRLLHCPQGNPSLSTAVSLRGFSHHYLCNCMHMTEFCNRIHTVCFITRLVISFSLPASM